ncbi:hypothetical protein BV210_02370 [Halorientalis sp. IM1011]|uniref:hypothetical protein n=1 Tax=Halorientalis sp. IM1011 TaxID=1932360 RepID=UPI00097CCBF6|nr:hypothetical protein [Halorientalis sp. IM1011]AQL41629.1 hypothetical protein BV210_02370 [Halorientalis sp. IM1011]
MRARVVWITIGDVDILEFLDGHELDEFEAQPSHIAKNTTKAASTVRDRIRVLRVAGLVERTDDRGYYRISDLGRRYLSDDLTEDELEELEDFDPDSV